MAIVFLPLSRQVRRLAGCLFVITRLLCWAQSISSHSSRSNVGRHHLSLTISSLFTTSPTYSMVLCSCHQELIRNILSSLHSSDFCVTKSSGHLPTDLSFKKVFLLCLQYCCLVSIVYLCYFRLLLLAVSQSWRYLSNSDSFYSVYFWMFGWLFMKSESTFLADTYSVFGLTIAFCLHLITI